MQSLKNIIENDDTRGGKLFDLIIQFLIILSITCFAVETLPNLSLQAKKILRLLEIVTVIIFTIEYILRIVVSENRFRFFFSFYGLIDLLAILPFYVTRGIDLRSIRIIRLFRVIRTFKIFRYSKAIKRFNNAFKVIKEELLLFLLFTVFLLFISSIGIYYFENMAQPDKFQSIFHCMWWAVETLTTVGYGDISPVTTGGKIFTAFIVIIGIGIIAVPSGLIASALTKTIEEEKDHA